MKRIEENGRRILLAEADEAILLGGTHYRGPIFAEVSRYVTNDAAAIVLVTYEEGYPELLSAVTVNLPDQTPADGCVWVRDYSEGEGMVSILKVKGWGETTGRRASSGYVTIPEVRLTGDLRELAVRQGVMS